METVENMAPLSDTVTFPQIKDEFVLPLEVEIEPEDITSADDNGDCFLDDTDVSLLHICSLCSFIAPSLFELRRHIRYIHQQKKYNRRIYHANLKNGINEETEEDSDNPLLECYTCGYKTRLKGKLEEHVLAHSDPRPYSCDFCSYRTGNVIHLRQHVERHWGIRPYACERCGYSAQSASDLKKHTRVHDGIRPFTCEICDYKTTTKNYLKMHMSKHTGERPFKCEHCDYRTARRGDLSSHMISHSKDKPYMCPCGFKTARPAHLKRHMATHNTKRRFECEECHKKYFNMDELKKHSKIHSPEKMHACPFCNYRALALYSVKRHVRRKHSQENISKTNDKEVNLECNNETKKDILLELRASSENSLTENPPELAEKTSSTPEVKKEFVCSHCDYSAKDHQEFEEHMSSHHSNNDNPG